MTLCDVGRRRSIAGVRPVVSIGAGVLVGIVAQRFTMAALRALEHAALRECSHVASAGRSRQIKLMVTSRGL